MSLGCETPVRFQSIREARDGASHYAHLLRERTNRRSRVLTPFLTCSASLHYADI
jgi:hypothetical protein